MYLSENLERSQRLAPPQGGRKTGPLAAQGGGAAKGPGRKKISAKIKVMDSGVSPQVQQGCDKRPGSAVHRSTVLQHDLLHRS